MPITKKYILSIGFLFIFFAVKGQQDPQFSQILFNPMSINPGYAGSLNMIGFGAINKMQWAGFGDGAPVSTAVSINSPISPFGFNSGIGLSILNDKYGFSSDLGISFSYAARFKFKVIDGSLGIGVNGGVVNNSINPSAWKTPDGNLDPSIPQKKESSINFDLGLGLYYNTENMFFGLSATHLNESKMNKSSQPARYTRNYYVTGGYIVNFAQVWQFEPSVLITTDISSSRFAFNSIVRYNKKFWGGVSYRIGEAITGMVGIELFNGIKIGYAYDYSTSRISRYNDGSHEFMLGYNFQLKKEKPPQQYKSIRFL